jgi:chemotaxis family two-component system response regulator Rcp1
MVALEKVKIVSDIHVINNGSAALAYLREKCAGSNKNRPDLILLDLNLPGMSGIEVLQQIKNEETLLTIPVVILTSSDDEHDISQTYSHHANCYITKPLELQGFIEIVQSIENFWFTVVKLPNDSVI